MATTALTLEFKWQDSNGWVRLIGCIRRDGKELSRVWESPTLEQSLAKALPDAATEITRIALAKQ